MVRETATQFNRSTLAEWDIRRHVTDDVIGVIDRPHLHEGENNKPIWIIWDVREGCAPQIDTLCDSADSAVYHYSMIADEIERSRATYGKVKRTAYVERVPANHRFASTVSYLFDGPIAYGRPKRRRADL